MTYSIKQLTLSDVDQFKDLIFVFGKTFNEPETYGGAFPEDEYLASLLGKVNFIVIVATYDKNVIGGLVAYVLEKFEKDRREIYIYDLAVLENHRRKGIATKLINELKTICKKLDAYVIFVQADYGDIPAIKLYESFGRKEEVLHFDIPID